MITRRHWLGSSAALALAPLPRWSQAAAPLSGDGGPGQLNPLSPDERALHALNRLGFGPRPGDAAAIQALGAQAWLQQFLAEQLAPAKLAQPAPLQARLQALDTLELGPAELLQRYRAAQQANREQARRGEMDGAKSAATAQNARRELVRPVLLQAGSQRLLRALQSPAQLEEVLVDFWFNHFNVFVGKGPVSVLVGDYEARAIRPHVLGSFRAMLGATAKHPAMLLYLDNAQSVVAGYQPPARQARQNPNAQRPTGLNENYARELMELHTLGVDGGYSQRDVTELARILTGWTIDYRGQRRRGPAGDGSLFVFDPARHDGGVKQWLGQTVRPAGQAEGERALDVLAAHPATARHLAFKLAQAFVADVPPPALVDKLARRFLASAGPDQLRAVMQALLESDEFWRREAYGAKFKTPYQYLLSSLRALDALPEQMQPLLASLAQAGMPLYGAATPDGYKNVASAWMNPEALAQRIELAKTLGDRRARRAGATADGLLSTLGPLISAATRQTVAAEPAPVQTALLLGSPDFMRR